MVRSHNDHTVFRTHSHPNVHVGFVFQHYPDWAFSKTGAKTIVPVQPLEKWEVIGQRVGMSSKDISQLRMLYQCSTGPRSLNSLTIDNLCSVECKCWEFALGTCASDDECMGDLVCGPTPTELPVDERFRDQLPPFEGSPTDVRCTSNPSYCHASCCNYQANIILCPETCDTAPPYVEPVEVPPQMCLPPGLTNRPSGSPTISTEPTESPTVSVAPTTTTSPTESPTERVSDDSRCRNPFISVHQNSTLSASKSVRVIIHAAYQ